MHHLLISVPLVMGITLSAGFIPAESNSGNPERIDHPHDLTPSLTPLGGVAYSALQWVTDDTPKHDIMNRLAAREYHASENGRGLQAPNRAHNLRTYFEPTGVRVHDRTAKGDPILASLSLSGLGRGSSLKSMEEGTVTHAEGRVEIRRPGVREWYENSARGLEQGFTLESRPPGAGALVLELSVESARAVLQNETVILITDRGRRLFYGGLVAVDAARCVLDSHLEVPGGQRIRLVIEDRDATYPIIIDPLLTGMADFLLQSNQPDPVGFLPAGFGGNVAAAGDVNGDGFDDIIVGAPGWDGGDPHEGAAFVFLGSAAGLVGSDPTTAQAWIESNQFGAQFGTVAGAGDVNGDGFDDIIVGAHFYSDVLPGTALEVNGAAFLFLGSATGIVGTDPTTAHAWIKANQLGSDLGLSVSGAGDINGDGFEDIVVGVPKQGIPFPPNIPANQGSGNYGAVLVFCGSTAGITGTGFPDADDLLLPFAPDAPTTALLGFMGASVAGAGDVNGDGFADIIVGPDVVVYLGSAGGIMGTDPSTAHAWIVSDQTNSALGSSVSGAGDVNGDGFDDIIVGDPWYPSQFVPTGAAYVFLGSAAGITAINTTGADTEILAILGSFGARVSDAGDIDGDGFDEVIIAALNYPGSLNQEGVGFVFRGSAAGIQATSPYDADVRLESGQSEAIRTGNVYALDVSGAGDINGDGFADVMLGTGYYDVDQVDEGAVFVYLGNPWPANPNLHPVSNAGVDLAFVDVDDDWSVTVTVDGSGSFDPDGTIVSYAWLQGETLLGTSPQLTTVLPLVGGPHLLALNVTDEEGVTRGDVMTISVLLVDAVQILFDGFTGGFGEWVASGDVVLSSADPFPDPPQIRLGAAGASLRRSLDLPAGATGITLSYWGKATQFAPSDEILVRVSVDGGPFTTIQTITVAESNNQYLFYGGSAIPLGHSWYPATASTIEIEFVSVMSAGLFFVDLVKVRALSGPALDTDGDGTPDATDGCLLDPNKIAPGVCGCGVPDLDVNGNGTMDCLEPTCEGDITPPGGNGAVNIDDLVAVLNAFGSCPAPPATCDADIAPPGPPIGNGVVNIDDLVAVLNAFGVCP